MKKYTFIPVEGKIEEETKSELAYERMRDFVEGRVEIVPLGRGKGNLIINETGLLDDLTPNDRATEIWRKAYPIEKFPHNNLAFTVGIRGNAILEQLV